MSSYLFECPDCGNVHDIERPVQFSRYTAELPERRCIKCGNSGCVDCMNDDVCGLCETEVDKC